MYRPFKDYVFFLGFQLLNNAHGKSSNHTNTNTAHCTNNNTTDYTKKHTALFTNFDTLI